MLPQVSSWLGYTLVTNHSLRATAATRMFAAGVPEKVDAEFTGHKSLNALHQYERTSVDQVQAVVWQLPGMILRTENPLLL